MGRKWWENQAVYFMMSAGKELVIYDFVMFAGNLNTWRISSEALCKHVWKDSGSGFGSYY